MINIYVANVNSMFIYLSRSVKIVGSAIALLMPWNAVPIPIWYS